MTDKKTNSTKPTKKSLSDLLVEYGFLPPLTDKDIEQSNEKYGTTKVILPKEVDSPDFIFNESKKSLSQKKIGKVYDIRSKQNDYFKKLVLAAEIVNQLHTESTFGHIKFVKIYFICEEVCKIRLSTQYGQYAAGPLDPKNLYSIDAEFKKRKWFTVTKRKSGYGFVYSPDVNVNDYQIYYVRYFKNHINTIDNVINLFRKKSSDFCEIVATLLAVWKRELDSNCDFSNETLLNKFYSWSEEKKRFKKGDIEDALTWMNENNIIPIA